jgi:class 3 adenylate cyclase
LRAAIDATARGFTVIRIDPHGWGLSERNINQLSIDGLAEDIRAVVAKEHLERFILFGFGLMSFATIHYAATQPERVSHLILHGAAARGDLFVNETLRALADVAKVNWEVASDAILYSYYRRGNEGFGLVFNDSVDPAQFGMLLRLLMTVDLSSELASLRTPALVIRDRSERNLNAAAAREAAALIPNARFVEVDMTFDAPGPIARFLADSGALVPRPAIVPTGTAIILFTDIADSTGLTERLGDAAFRTAARALDEQKRAAIRDAGGSPVAGKVLGDGVMGVFTSAAQAIDAARRCVQLSADVELPLHIGIHAGDVIREEDNVYGGAVNLASRICALCEPGEVLVSQTVRDLARTSAVVAFDDRGEHTLKGIADPVRVFAVRAEA